MANALHLTVTLDDIVAAIGGVQKVHLEPGDVLFIQLDHIPRPVEANGLTASLKRLFAEHDIHIPVVVCGPDMKIGIVHQSSEMPHA